MACDAGSGGWRGREGSKEEQGRWEEGRDYICALVGRGMVGMMGRLKGRFGKGKDGEEGVGVERIVSFEF